jgi:hypothetical protein
MSLLTTVPVGRDHLAMVSPQISYPRKYRQTKRCFKVLKTTSKVSVNVSGVPYRESILIESVLDLESQTSNHSGTSPCFIRDKPGLSTVTRVSLYGTDLGGETAADTTTGTKPKVQPDLKYTKNSTSDEYTFSVSMCFSLDGSPKRDETREFAEKLFSCDS